VVRVKKEAKWGVHSQVSHGIITIKTKWGKPAHDCEHT
jgi:hypothetical protein